MSTSVIDSWCSGITLASTSPYLVKDQLVYGDMYSLIPLEFNWCRGYMMIQVMEDDLTKLIENGHIKSASKTPDYRDVSDTFSELTNLIWGKFKTHFSSRDTTEPGGCAIQVPIISSQRRDCVSFGTAIPQLTFKFRLTPEDESQAGVDLYQKFIFNLNWDPERMPSEFESVDELLDSGELELF